MTCALVKAASDVYRRVPQARRYSMTKVTAVIHQWNGGEGSDSAVIAIRTGLPEADVCRIIAADQDRRRTARRRTA